MQGSDGKADKAIGNVSSRPTVVFSSSDGWDCDVADGSVHHFTISAVLLPDFIPNGAFALEGFIRMDFFDCMMVDVRISSLLKTFRFLIIRFSRVSDVCSAESSFGNSFF